MYKSEVACGSFKGICIETMNHFKQIYLMTTSKQRYLNITGRRCTFKILDNSLLVLICHAKSTTFGVCCRFPSSYCLEKESNFMVSSALLVKWNLKFYSSIVLSLSILACFRSCVDEAICSTPLCPLF